MWGLSKNKPSVEAEFDIEGLDVFSVERDEDGDTRFGYHTEQKKLIGTEIVSFTDDEEWSVKTTDEQHRAFVARLAAKIARRANSAPAGTTDQG